MSFFKKSHSKTTKSKLQFSASEVTLVDAATQLSTKDVTCNLVKYPKQKPLHSDIDKWNTMEARLGKCYIMLPWRSARDSKLFFFQLGLSTNRLLIILQTTPSTHFRSAHRTLLKIAWIKPLSVVTIHSLSHDHIKSVRQDLLLLLVTGCLTVLAMPSLLATNYE